jgi:hypothetical protein
LFPDPALEQPMSVGTQPLDSLERR